ncbi:FtsX-like permease family protein [Tengunoibacter tsumagoiensis]|uniref:ABC3 transporter permease C-terminal domain-containing protein n=1 Tax=Tengunoibacter tsumagoiensis TaxID=2014871 RepID=A0A401ZV39_9CHLR|nr:ABC transporter permease [Tengunoibacter tsumagoiensis]GCE10600.1 hypothetical protein KTT_04590 [Tengunoibacter tsumagoiensis]
MFNYVFQTIGRQWRQQLFGSGGFLIAACAFLLLNATTQTIVFQARTIIGQNWRPTYDLVVLPSGTKSVESQQAVPPDHLTDLNPGISYQQYQQIKQLSGVAVAAPISFIGNARFPIPFINFGSQNMAPGFYSLTWKLSADDGIHQQNEYQQHELIYASDVKCPNQNCALSPQTKQYLSTLGVDTYFFPSKGPYLTGIPHPGTFLLAAIDPTAEDQLVHLKQSITSGEALPVQDHLQVDPQFPTVTGENIADVYPNYQIPVILNQNLPGSITMQATFTHLQTSSSDPQVLAAQHDASYLPSVPGQAVFTGLVPIPQNDIQLFHTGSSLNQQGSAIHVENYGDNVFNLNLVSRPSNVEYQFMAGKAPDGNPAYQIKPVPFQADQNEEYQGNALAFRSIQPLPGIMYQPTIYIGDSFEKSYTTNYYTVYNNAGYRVATTGLFDGRKLSAGFADALNWLPENTYTPSQTVLSYDANGKPLAPKILQPTTYTQGLTLQSPLALTTMTAARQMLGDNCINVIRIRVAGHISPDENGWKQVARVAQLIHERTGLQALVTLGSSPRPTLVYVPGVSAGELNYSQSIPPLGWVQERWISFGAGLLYLQQLGVTQNVLLSGVLLVCLAYLVLNLSSLVTAQRRQFAILSAVGWRPWHPPLAFLIQVVLMALSGGIAGLLLALGLTLLIGAAIPWNLVLWTLPGILALALISLLVPLWQLWRVRPLELLRSGSRVVRGSQRTLPFQLPTALSMTVRNLARSRWRALILLVSLFCSSGLLTLTLHGILTLRQTLQGTLLGDFVLLQTAIPQLCGVLFTMILAVLSLADLLIMQVRERQQEIGVLQALGWRPGMIRGMFLQEGLLLALLGIVPGIGAALWIVLAQKQYLPPLTVAEVAATVLLLLLAGVLVGILPALRVINRLSVLQVLRAE